MLASKRLTLLIGALITLPAIAIVVFMRDDRATDTVLFVHTLIFDAITTLYFVGLLRDYRRGKPFDQPVSPAASRRMQIGIAFFALNVIVTATSIATIPLTFPTIAALVIGVGFVIAPIIVTTLLAYSFQLNKRFGKVWVKALDFPYLLLAFLGLLRMPLPLVPAQW